MPSELYRLRIAQNIESVRELARISGVGRAAIDKLESGRGNPTAKTVIMLARALRVDPLEIFKIVMRNEDLKNL